MPFAIRPVLLIQATAASPQETQAVLVLHLHVRDTLLHHIALVLRVTSTADSHAGRLYAAVLTEALATHLLRRYAACQPTQQECPRELAPAKLRRTVAYIHAHLEEPLPLTAIAAVAQLNPAYFARLFKQATGLTPHQYVLVCRMERAKQLLTETALPLSEIGLQVGCTDQSYFTAVFRCHVGTTPKAYRDATANL
jgi:AraC family transcriptional regulator